MLHYTSIMLNPHSLQHTLQLINSKKQCNNFRVTCCKACYCIYLECCIAFMTLLHAAKHSTSVMLNPLQSSTSHCSHTSADKPAKLEQFKVTCCKACYCIYLECCKAFMTLIDAAKHSTSVMLNPPQSSTSYLH